MKSGWANLESEMGDIGSYRSPPRPTEFEAAKKIGPSIAPLKEMILAMIRNAGDRGVIPYEAWEQVIRVRPRTQEASVRPRFNDLCDEGLIRRNGVARENRRGNNEEVWVAGEEPEAVARSRINWRQRALDAEAEVERLRALLPRRTTPKGRRRR